VLVYATRFHATVMCVTAHTDDDESTLIINDDSLPSAAPKPTTESELDVYFQGQTVSCTWDMGTHFGGLWPASQSHKLLSHFAAGICSCESMACGCAACRYVRGEPDPLPLTPALRSTTPAPEPAPALPPTWPWTWEHRSTYLSTVGPWRNRYAKSGNNKRRFDADEGELHVLPLQECFSSTTGIPIYEAHETMVHMALECYLTDGARVNKEGGLLLCPGVMVMAEICGFSTLCAFMFAFWDAMCDHKPQALVCYPEPPTNPQDPPRVRFLVVPVYHLPSRNSATSKRSASKSRGSIQLALAPPPVPQILTTAATMSLQKLAIEELPYLVEARWGISAVSKLPLFTKKTPSNKRKSTGSLPGGDAVKKLHFSPDGGDIDRSGVVRTVGGTPAESKLLARIRHLELQGDSRLQQESTVPGALNIGECKRDECVKMGGHVVDFQTKFANEKITSAKLKGEVADWKKWKKDGKHGEHCISKARMTALNAEANTARQNRDVPASLRAEALQLRGQLTASNEKVASLTSKLNEANQDVYDIRVSSGKLSEALAAEKAARATAHAAHTSDTMSMTMFEKISTITGAFGANHLAKAVTESSGVATKALEVMSSKETTAAVAEAVKERISKADLTFMMTMLNK
jgi:predicted  nucleic acid-binding Zn-ribbon protein